MDLPGDTRRRFVGIGGHCFTSSMTNTPAVLTIWIVITADVPVPGRAA
jgi:hypothetical protein